MTEVYREEDYHSVHETMIENIRMNYDAWEAIKDNAKKLGNWSGVDVARAKMNQFIRRAHKIRA